MRSSDGSRDEENIADSAGSENEMFSRFPDIFGLCGMIQLWPAF